MRPLQEGHGCITMLVNPSYRIQLLNVNTKIKIVSFKKFSEVGDVGLLYLAINACACVLAARVINIRNCFTARRVCIARTMPWRDVCLSVCLYVTRRYSV